MSIPTTSPLQIRKSEWELNTTISGIFQSCTDLSTNLLVKRRRIINHFDYLIIVSVTIQVKAGSTF